MGTVKQDNKSLGSKRGLLEGWSLLCMQKTDREMEAGEQGLPRSGGITPKSPRGEKTVFSGKRCLQMRQGQGHSMSWGGEDHFQGEETENPAS